MTPPTPDDGGPAAGALDDGGPLSCEPPSHRIVLWIGALALAVRLPHLAEVAASAFYGVPILDEAFYDLAARHLLEGNGLDGASLADLNPGFRPLLYPAFLAVAYVLGGDHGLFVALGAQHLLGAATAVLVALFAARLFRRDAPGYVAGALYALAGPPLFYEGRLLITSLYVFLVVALLVVLGQCRPRGGARAPWILAGVLVGVAVQARPNALVFALALVAVPAWTAWRTRQDDEPLRRGPAHALAAVLALAATLLVAAAIQAPLLGRFTPLPSSGGVNLYLGNERGADGMVPRQDRHATYGDAYRDSVQRFAVEEYAKATGDAEAEPSAVSRYWIGRTLEEVRADPVGRLALLARKAWLLAWPPEVPNNLSYAFVAAKESRILRWLPVRWIWLLPLAAAGLVIATGRASAGSASAGRIDPVRLRWLVALGALHAATVVAFFVAGRFRIPLWPLAAILAGGALVALADAVRGRAGPSPSRRRLLTALVVALAVFAIGQVPWPGVELPTPARDFFYRSLAHYEKGDLAAARADAESAVDLEPTNAAALFQLGTVLLAEEEWQRAADVLLRASRRLHTEPRPFNNLGIALEKLGHTSDAYAAYLRAIDAEPDFSPAWVNAALLELRAGRTDLARERIERAEALEDAAGRRTVPRLAARAFLERDLGNAERAAEVLEEALRRDPEAVRALLEDNARRLELRHRPK